MEPWPSRPAARIARKLVTFGFGLLTGAQLFVALGLVPSWRVQSAASFVESYGAILRTERTDVLMPIFGITIIIPSVVAIVVDRPRSARHWFLAMLPILALVVIVGITAKINVPINDWVVAMHGVPDASAVAKEQARWVAAHYVRTGIAIAAYASIVASVSGTSAPARDSSG